MTRLHILSVYKCVEGKGILYGILGSTSSPTSIIKYA